MRDRKRTFDRAGTEFEYYPMQAELILKQHQGILTVH